MSNKNRFSNNPFQGGAGLATGELAQDLSDMVDALAVSKSGCIQGGIVTTATHTQVAGTGATTWTVAVSALDVLVNGVYKNEGTQAAFSVHASTCLVTDGQSIYVWLIEQNSAGTLSTVAVAGTAATSGDETVPSDADILAATGLSMYQGKTYPFVKLALLHVARVGTTLTETIDMSYRQSQGGLHRFASFT